MTILALITTARCADLTALCVDSLQQYAPKVTRLILVNQFDRPLRRWLAETGEVYFVNDSARGDGSDLLSGRAPPGGAAAMIQPTIAQLRHLAAPVAAKTRAPATAPAFACIDRRLELLPRSAEQQLARC